MKRVRISGKLPPRIRHAGSVETSVPSEVLSRAIEAEPSGAVPPGVAAFGVARAYVVSSGERFGCSQVRGVFRSEEAAGRRAREVAEELRRQERENFRDDPDYRQGPIEVEVNRGDARDTLSIFWGTSFVTVRQWVLR